MAPDVGFEPTTKRLTAAYSTAELIWNFAQTIKRNFSVFFVKSQVKWCRYALKAKKRAKKLALSSLVMRTDSISISQNIIEIHAIKSSVC